VATLRLYNTVFVRKAEPAQRLSSFPNRLSVRVMDSAVLLE
jgi:hypothetical protein